MKSVINWVLDQKIFFEVLTILIIFGGIFATGLIQKEDLPKITVPIVTITSIYPGASPADVEYQLTNKIENALMGIDGLKKLTSISVTGKSIVKAELNEDENTLNNFSNDINRTINSLKSLPDLEIPPRVMTVNTNLRPILQVFVSGDKQKDVEKELDFLRVKFEKIPGVAKVDETGVLDRELLVEVDTKKANNLRLDLNDIVSQVRTASSNNPAGEVKDEEKVYSLQSKPMANQIGEFGALAIKSPDSGRSITLKKIAEISIGEKKGEPTYLINGKRARGLQIVKNSKGDIVNISQNVKNILSERKQKFTDLDYQIFNDASERVVTRLKVLTNNLVVGILLVIFILSIVLPFKIALIVAMGIPVSTLGGLLLMEYLGISLNMLTMMGFIIAIGIVVDDAIVFVESCYERLEKGLSKKDAVVEGISRVFWPVTVSVLTTVVSFSAIFFIPGILGKFIYYLPIAIIFSLLISLAEGLTILSVHFYSWINLKTASAKKAKFWENIKSAYGKVLNFSLKGRYIVLCIYAVLFAFSLNHLLGSKFVLFPSGEISKVELRVHLTENIADELSQDAAIELSSIIKKEFNQEIDTIRTTVGLDWDSKLADSSRLIFDIEVAEDQSATENVRIFGESLKALLSGHKQVSNVNVKYIQDGPPVGEAFQLTIRGDNFQDIENAISHVKGYLDGLKGVIDIRENSYKKQDYEVVLDHVSMSKVSLNTADLSARLNQHLSGSVAGEFWDEEKNEPLDIRVVGKHRELKNIEKELKIKNQRGNFIPFGKIGDLNRKESRNAINHSKKQKEITVYANVDNVHITSKTLNEKVQKYVENKMQKDFPQLQFGFEGEESERIESLSSIYLNFFIIAAVILMLLLLQFRSFTYPILVILTIPFCICGVAITLYAHNEPVSFLALLGGLALAGVVVNDSIVMLDRLRSIRSSSRNTFSTSSIIDAAKERIRPILLTTVTTFLGVLPTAYGIGGLDKFVQPVALSLGWGITVATVMVLIVLPVLVKVFDDILLLLSLLLKTKHTQIDEQSQRNEHDGV